MKRRAMLVAATAASLPWSASVLSGCAAPSAPPGSVRRPAAPVATPPIRPADTADVALLNRVTWGIDSASLAAFQATTRGDYLGSQLYPPRPARLPSDVQSRIDLLSIRQKPMMTWAVEMNERRREADALADDDAKKTARQAYEQGMNQLARDSATETLLRSLYSPNQLQEQLAWFWVNHFNVHERKANLRVLVGDYQNRLRGHSLGKFRDLLIASATHPAMIRYLDNEQNAANRINENYAREIMELHTLGVDGGYSQKDVQELARVLTGLGVNYTGNTPKFRAGAQGSYVRDGATEFNPSRHDMGEKTVLGARSAGTGWQEIMDQLGRLARHPATARRVSRQLAVYFVADQPPAAIVQRMTDAFTDSDGEIAVTLQAMFDSPEFAGSLQHKFKDPMHYVVSAVRLAYDGRPVLNVGPMLNWLNRLGEGLWNRQTPDGYPLDEASWSSSGQMSTRFEIARNIGSGSAGLFRLEGAPADAPAFPQLSNALYHQALAGTLSERTRQALNGATSSQEWNVLLLSSPEFMYR